MVVRHGPDGTFARRALAVAEALFDNRDEPPPAARLAWASADLEAFVRAAGPRSSLLLGGALRLCTWVAPAMVGRLGPLGRLPVSLRIEALERLEATPLGLPVLALKAIFCTVYYEHPDAEAEIEFARRPFGGEPS
ncbi:MAG: hypothetical protein AAGA56_16755 [Myxococcota bacterium]